MNEQGGQNGICWKRAYEAAQRAAFPHATDNEPCGERR